MPKRILVLNSRPIFRSWVNYATGVDFRYSITAPGIHFVRILLIEGGILKPYKKEQ